MPIYNKLYSAYTIKGPFVAGGGNYTAADAAALALWIRFRATPADESGNGLTVSYDGTPVTNNQLIPSEAISRIGELPVVEFSNSGNTNAKVNGTPLMIFNNGSSDTPFTFSTWAKTSAPWSGLAHYFFGQENVAGSTYSLSWGPESSSGMTLQMKNAAGNSYIAFPSPSVPNPTAGNEWVHYAVTYDGTSSVNGVRFYLNGESIGGKATVGAGYVFNDTNSANPNYVGADRSGGKELDGEMSEFCTWRKVLTPSAIKAIYHSTAGRYTAQSGEISLPSRVIVREEDNYRGSYPNQLRTTGEKGDSKGNIPIVFDDRKVQTFETISNAVFPMVNSNANLENLNTSRLIPTPNQTSDIVSLGTAGPILSTEGTFIDENTGITIKPFNESRIFLEDKLNKFYASGTKISDYPGYPSPLRDKIIMTIPINSNQEKIISRYDTTAIHNSRYKDGLFPNGHVTSGFFYYNFEKNGWEDVGLKTHGTTGDRSSMFYTGSVTADKLSCVSLAKRIKDFKGYVSKYGYGSIGEPPGNLPKLYQFKMSDHMGVFIDSVADTRTFKPDPYSDLTSSLGYHLLGAATGAGLAPYHPRFHGSGSNTIKLSDYITGDFLLEKAVIDIPVIVQRQRGTISGDGSTSGNRFFDSCRDIDNYMFFLYKQSRSPKAGSSDSQYAMTASMRELIASGAASFYNSYAFSGRVPAQVRERGLPHKPSFSYDFFVTSSHSQNAAPPAITAFTGTIRIEMQVATPTGQPVGGSRFPMSGERYTTSGLPLQAPGGAGNASAANHQRSVVVQDWWTGDRTFLSSSLAQHSTFNQVNCNQEIFSSIQNYCAGLKPFSAHQTPTIRSENKDNLGAPDLIRSPGELVTNRGMGFYENLDYAPIESAKGRISNKKNSSKNIGMLGYTSYDSKIGGAQAFPILFGSLPSSDISPFMFEPGDELILGIDAGISMLPSSGTLMGLPGTVDAGTDLGFYSASWPSGPAGLSFGCMSGSFMKIMTGEAKLTLFGSQMRENREVLGSSNQGLTTDAIHESVGDARVTDQIDVPSRFDLSGSYVDRLIFGNIKVSQSQYDESCKVMLPGINRMIEKAHGVWYTRTARGTVSLFSKNRTGYKPIADTTDTLDPHLPLYTGPNYDQSEGFPPSATTPLDSNGSLLTSPATQFYIGNGDAPFGRSTPSNSTLPDPYFITPFKSKFMLGANIVSLQRFITIPDAFSTYYDSMTPDIVDFANRQNKSDSTTPVIRVMESEGKSFVSLKIWTYNSHKTSVYPYVGNPTRYINQKIKGFFVPSGGPDAGSSAGTSHVFSAQSNKAEKLLKMTVFNRGFQYSTFKAGVGALPNLYDYGHDGLFNGAYGPLYGMISPLPMRPTARFRRDRFGQFRDMLEQRLDTKCFITPVKNLTLAGVSYINDSPVQIKFVDNSDGVTSVNPFSTDSINCSSEYTSSMPYSDLGSSRSTPGSGGDIVSLGGTMTTWSSAFAASTLPSPFTS